MTQLSHSNGSEDYEVPEVDKGQTLLLTLRAHSSCGGHSAAYDTANTQIASRQAHRTQHPRRLRVSPAA